MADTIDITAGAGTTVATDDVGGVHYQQIKLIDGTADSSTGVYVDVGAKANALRIAPANDITDGTYIGDIKFGEAEPNSAAILSDTTDIKTAIELIDNAVDGNYLNVNSNIAGTDIVGGAGAVAAGVQRVTLASDDPAVVDLAAIEVLLGTIDTDTGNIATSLGNIDNAVDGNYLNVNMNLAGTDAQAGEGVITASTQRVTLATDDDGVAHLATIAGDTTSIDGKITACNTGAVVLAASDGTDIGDVDVASIAAGTNVIGKVRLVDDGGTEITENTDHSMNVTIVADDVGIGGGTQYTEDAIAAADPVGNAVIMVREDSPESIAADGDNVAQRCTQYGSAFVQVVDSSGNFIDTFGGSGGTAAADDADFVAGTTQGTPAMGVYESSPTSVTDGDLGTVGITATRSLKVEETNSSAILADTANMDTNLGTLAGAVAGTELQVDIVSDGAGLATDAKLDDIIADTAAIQTAVELIDDAISGSEMQVDVVASLPAGDNNIGNVDIASSVALDVSAATVTVDATGQGDVPITLGGETVTLAANSGVDIGDVDVTSVIPGTGAANIGKAEDAAHSTGDVGVMMLAVRQDSGTNPSAEADTEGDYIPLITNATGELYVQDSGIYNTLSDWDSPFDSAIANYGAAVAAKYDSTKPTAVDDGDAVALLADQYGRLLAGVEPTAWQAVYDSADATGEGEVVKASAASTIVVVQSYIISSDVEGWIKLQDEDSTALTGKFWLKAGGGVAITLPENAPIVLGTDKDLEVICEAAGNVSVSATGYTIPG